MQNDLPDSYYILTDAVDLKGKNIPTKDLLLSLIKAFRHPIKFNTLSDSCRNSVLAAELKNLHAEVILPLFEGDKFLGFIALSRKRNNDTYTTEDLNLLMVLTNQFVTALSAAQLYIEAVEKRRFENELRMARQIQANLLPASLPNNDTLSMAAISTPSLTVGGDFYDYIRIDQNQHGIVIADACGKGLPAAMLISQIQAMLKSEINNGNSLQKILGNINNQIVQFTPNDKFVTLFLGIYDEKSKQFEYASAGHNFPILVRASGEYEYLEIGGPALGILKDAIYNTGITILDTDNVMLLYTDGITETINDKQEDYGEERLLNMLVCNRKQSAQDIVEIIIGDLQKFTKMDALHDDRTMLVLKT
jgi:sigma-B regulation protein RsbU (phosphoserine phosphatase)